MPDDNGYKIVPLAEVPIDPRSRVKGSSCWQPIIDLALAHVGSAVEIVIAEHPRISAIKASHRASALGSTLRRSGIKGWHTRTVAGAMYFWIDPPPENKDA